MSDVSVGIRILAVGDDCPKRTFAEALARHHATLAFLMLEFEKTSYVTGSTTVLDILDGRDYQLMGSVCRKLKVACPRLPSIRIEDMIWGVET